MGERKGQNKYYPPDWRPEHGSLDKFHGTHPLRDRARKLDRGILIIRFEMPYNVWCEGCNNHVGMGVRYNAEKSKVGMYYSTPIYKFKMKCVYCPTFYEIQTDPKNCDYVCIAGCRRQNNRWKAEDAEQIEAVEYNTKTRLKNDAMFNLEYGKQDEIKAQKEIPTLHELQDIQEVWRDNYSANCYLRKQFRDEKKKIAKTAEDDEKLTSKLNLDIKLVPEVTKDAIQAKETFLRIRSSSQNPSKVVKSKVAFGSKLSQKSVKLKTLAGKLGVDKRLLESVASVTPSKPVSGLVRPSSKSCTSSSSSSSSPNNSHGHLVKEENEESEVSGSKDPGESCPKQKEPREVKEEVSEPKAESSTPNGGLVAAYGSDSD